MPFTVFEDGVPEAVADDIGRCAASRHRGWRPELTGLFIPKVECLAPCIRNGIVVPRRKAELMAIFRPGIGAADAETTVPNCGLASTFDQGSRSHLAGGKRYDIFSTIRGKAAQSIIENQLGLGRASWANRAPGNEKARATE